MPRGSKQSLLQDGHAGRQPHAPVAARGSLYAEEGADHRLATTRFDRAARRAFFEVQSEQTAKSHLRQCRPGPQDGLAVALRASHAGVRRPAIACRDTGCRWRLALHGQREIAAPEMVRVPLGEFSRLGPQSQHCRRAGGSAAWKQRRGSDLQRRPPPSGEDAWRRIVHRTLSCPRCATHAEEPIIALLFPASDAKSC